MNVLIVSAEAVPFAKVGGLADVAGSLPSALRDEGIDARLIMPGYGFIEHFKYDINLLFTFQFRHRNGVSDVYVYACIYDDVPVYFVQGFPYFGQDDTVYTDWNWDVPRFIFFNQIVMAVAWQLQERLGWFPDVFHLNDWHTSLLPFLLTQSHWKREWTQVASIVSIHNIAYQGNNIGGFMYEKGIPGRDHDLLARYDLHDNMLGIGIAYADMVNTVSPRYATEIQYAYAGYELAPIINHRRDSLRGILNGIDVKRWNPATDTVIAAPFDAHNFRTARPANKRHLQAWAGLPVRDDVPLIGVVSRLTWQKGFDLAVPALWQLMAERDAQLVLLGTGEERLEDEFRRLQGAYGDKVRVFLEFDATKAQHIYAGCDMFLMPSHFEPCGIGQMIAMRYGALPIVRETGGLADTVTNYDNDAGAVGTGFVFEWEETSAVKGTLDWAIDTYHQRPQAWQRMQARAMQRDFSWTKSAQAYIDLYKQAIQQRKDLAVT
jgi:starch synthase